MGLSDDKEVIKAQNKVIREYVVEVKALNEKIRELIEADKIGTFITSNKFDAVWKEFNPNGGNWVRRRLKKGMGFFEDPK